MTSLDLRVGALSLLGNPGTSRTLRLIFTSDGNPVTPGPVSVWIGGDERHPNDFTGAVEHVAVVDGNEATVTVPIPAGRELLRLTIDGALATVGHVAPSLRGTFDQDQTAQVNLGAVEVHLDLAAVPLDLAARLEALEADKQDADPALDELSGINVEEWGRSWLAIADAAAARAELGLGAAATMSPVEVVTDPDAQAALSGAFARGHYWPRIPGQAIRLQNPDVANFVNVSLGGIGRAFVDLVVVPFDATIVAYHFSVQTAGDATATIRPALYRQNSVDASVALERLHDGSPMAADSTGPRSVTGLSIPVTAGTVLRPAVKMETGTSAPSVFGHKTSAPTSATLATVLAFGGAGLNYKPDHGAGEWETSLVVTGSQSNGPRMLVEVVPS